MSRFREMMLVVLASGALAGLALFAVQRFTVIPLIETAETYEAAEHQSAAGAAHEEEGWQPANGWERTSLTALTTMLSGIGFAAMLFGSLSLTGSRINTSARRALGTGRICMLRPGAGARITSAASRRRCCRLVSTPDLVG